MCAVVSWSATTFLLLSVWSVEEFTGEGERLLLLLTNMFEVSVFRFAVCDGEGKCFDVCEGVLGTWDGERAGDL